MEERQANFQQADTGGKTTCTFRIMPHEKLLLATKANELGLSPSQYIEALVLGQHNELVQRLEERDARSKHSRFTDEQLQLFNAFLGKLQQRFPENTPGEIILAAIIHAHENHEVFWQRSMRTFIKRVRNNHYKL